MTEARDDQLEDRISAEQLAVASGLSADEVVMLGRPPYDLLRSQGRAGQYRLSQVTWARTLATMRKDRRLTWLEIRSWAERRQRRR